MPAREKLFDTIFARDARCITSLAADLIEEEQENLWGLLKKPGTPVAALP